jgi:MarR family 2-MHQ and catechol resistance regulon transcriptional repressor
MNLGNYRSNLSLDEKVLMGIVRVSELFKKRASEIFKNYGLTFAQYNVLRVLSSSDDGTNTVTNVSRIMLVTGANMTGISKRMERDGFLLRKRHPTDERVTLLEITPKGRQALHNIMPEKENFITALMGDRPEVEKDRLLEILRQLIRKNQGQ